MSTRAYLCLHAQIFTRGLLVDSRAQYEHGLAFGVRDDMPVDVHIRKDTGKSKQTVNLIVRRRANATANMYYKCALSFIDIEVLF